MKTLPKFDVIDDEMVEVLRAKSPAERLSIAMGLWRTARSLMGAGIRADNPNWNEDEVNREIARRVSYGAMNHATE